MEALDLDSNNPRQEDGTTILNEELKHKKQQEKQNEDVIEVKESKLSPYPYFSIYFFPILAMCSVWFGGTSPLISAILFFVISSILEYVIGSDGYNPTKAECKYLENQKSFRFITWLWVPVQIGLVIATTLTIGNRWEMGKVSWIEFWGAVIIVGSNSGGIGITVAHELIHKQNWLEQFFGKVILHFVCYTHFYIEHLLGHHKKVGTRDDPASSKFGENVYWFIPKSVIFSFVSACHLESKRLQKEKLPVYSLKHNQMIHFVLLSMLTFIIFGLIGGKGSVIFFLAQSVAGFTLLEIVNYIEHYGLRRREIGGKGSGVFEKVSPLHSWNADHRLSNYFIFKLQRHADHHTWPTRRYQTLRSWDFSPQLPTGYIGMVLIALVPPLFHYIMDPKVIQYNAIMYGDHNPEDDEKSDLIIVEEDKKRQ